MEKERKPMPEKKEKEMHIPSEVQGVLHQLEEAGYEAYAVGGCVRDMLLDREPKDWDITTNAKPEQIQDIFGEEDSFYTNAFGTVGIKTRSGEEATAIVEATTYRTEGRYTDKRHPDHVEFTDSLEEDLARRDFTMNAMATDGTKIIDPFNGREDLRQRRIRAVGEASERFEEDALRLMRAVRFATQLEFSIEEGTSRALEDAADNLEVIAKERIRDELGKMIMSDRADYGIELLREYRLLQHVLPELEEGWGVTQNQHHIYTVWEHNIKALRYACDEDYSFSVRLASLLHDVGKPRTKSGDGPNSTFYGHEVVGGRLVKKMLTRLRFPSSEVDHMTLLVRQHMFNYDPEGPEAITDAGVRRLVVRVGIENMDDLIRVRQADRIGSGVPKAVPYRLRHFMYRVEKVMHDPVSRKQLAVDGKDLLEELEMSPGPRLGAVIDALFEEVLDDPTRNDREKLLARAQELNTLSDKELEQLRLASKEKYESVLGAEEDERKKRWHVQ